MQLMMRSLLIHFGTLFPIRPPPQQGQHSATEVRRFTIDCFIREGLIEICPKWSAPKTRIVFFLCVCRTVSFLQSRLTGNYTVINMVANMVSTVKQGNRQPKHFGLQGRWVDCIFKTWCLHYPWCNLATEWHHWRHFFQITWGNKRLILHFLEYVVLLPKTCKPTLMCKGRLWLRGLNQHLVAHSVALVCMLKCTWATYWTPNSSLQWQPLPSVYEGITVSRFGQRHLPNALNVCM